MSKEFTERGLARSVTYKAQEYLNSSGFSKETPVKVGGLEIDFPYSAIGENPVAEIPG